MEFETRLIDINVDNIRKILTDNNAEKVKVEDQINDIYDFEDKRLLNKKGYARIRTIYDHLHNETIYYMTTKKIVSQGKFKVMDENETIIENKKAGEGIFKSLGLCLNQSIKKYRESYRIFDSLVQIDIYIE